MSGDCFREVALGILIEEVLEVMFLMKIIFKEMGVEFLRSDFIWMMFYGLEHMFFIEKHKIS